MAIDEDMQALRRDFDKLPTPESDFRGVMKRIRSRRARRYVVGGLTVVLFAAAVAIPMKALLPLAHHETGEGDTIARSSVTISGQETTQIPAGLTDVVLGFGSVWLPGSETLTRLDAQSGSVVASIPVPGSSDYRTVAVGEGSVWVTDSGQESVFRVDPGTNELVATVKIKGPPLGIAVGGGYVWVTVPTESEGLLYRIDPGTDGVSGAAIPVGVGPRSVNYLDGYLWVNDTDGSGSVTLVNAATGKANEVSGEGFPRSFGDGSIWTAEDGTVTRVDPATDAVEATIQVIRASDVAFGEGGAWVLSDSGSTSSTTYEPDPAAPATVQRIDVATNSPVGEPVAVGMTPGFLAVGLGAVWFGDFTNSTLTRVEVEVT